jgi:hypothetical protein
MRYSQSFVLVSLRLKPEMGKVGGMGKIREMAWRMGVKLKVRGCLGRERGE